MIFTGARWGDLWVDTGYSLNLHICIKLMLCSKKIIVNVSWAGVVDYFLRRACPSNISHLAINQPWRCKSQTLLHVFSNSWNSVVMLCTHTGGCLSNLGFIDQTTPTHIMSCMCHDIWMHVAWGKLCLSLQYSSMWMFPNLWNNGRITYMYQ